MADNKKEEFRGYLEEKQVLDVMTTAMVDLFYMNPKPEDPLQFFSDKFKEARDRLLEQKKAEEQSTEQEAPKES